MRAIKMNEGISLLTPLRVHHKLCIFHVGKYKFTIVTIFIKIFKQSISHLISVVCFKFTTPSLWPVFCKLLIVMLVRQITIRIDTYMHIIICYIIHYYFRAEALTYAYLTTVVTLTIKLSPLL